MLQNNSPVGKVKINNNVSKHPEPNKIASNLLRIPKINKDFLALAGIKYKLFTFSSPF